MKDKPLLSILIPHYNMPHSLPRLLDSILIQSLKDLEVIVVDDGSTQSCRHVIDAYCEKELALRLIEHGVNRGTKEARLTGVKHAQGRVIAFADADDLFLGTDILEYHVRLLLHENVDIVHFNTMLRIPETGQEELFIARAPFAEVLSGKDVFAAYVNSMNGRKAGVLWGKLYSGKLCRTCLPAASTLALRRFAEDFYLASLYFANAEQYRGSNFIGYYWTHTPQGKVATRAPRILCALSTIEAWFSVYLQDKNFAPAIINAFKADITERMLQNAVRLERACRLPDSEAIDQDALRAFTAGVDMAALDRVLKYALAESGGRSEAQSAARLRETLSKFHGLNPHHDLRAK